MANGFKQIIKSNFKRILIFIAAVVIAVLWWRVTLADNMKGYEEIALEDGQTSFTADFSKVSYIVVNNNSVSLKEKLDAQNASVYFYIIDKNQQTAAECSLDSISIHTNGYSYTQNSIFSNLPVELKEGESYSIFYAAKAADGTELHDLSFLLYGDEISTVVFKNILLGIVILVLAIVIFGWKRPQRPIASYFAIWILVAAFLAFIMPSLQSAKEQNSFARVYAVSSQIIGETAADSEGSVYIEESGIRNGGYISYNEPLMRFWSDWKYGNERTKGQTSSLYTLSQVQLNGFMLPAVMAVTIARLLKLPYQMLFLLTWAVNLVLVLLLLQRTLRLSRGNTDLSAMIKICMLFPSVIVLTLSFSGMGILVAACALYMVLCTRIADSDEKFLQRFTAAAVLLFLIITVNYAYIVLLAVLVESLRCRKTEDHQVLPKAAGLLLYAVYIAEMAVMFVRTRNTFQYAAQGELTVFSGPILFIKAVINTLLSQIDSYITAFAGFDYFSLENCRLLSYALLVLFLLALYRAFGKQPDETGKRTFQKAAVLWLLGLFLLFTSQTYAVNDAGNGIFASMSGMQLIPFAFIVWNRSDRLCVETDSWTSRADKMVRIAALCSMMIIAFWVGVY